MLVCSLRLCSTSRSSLSRFYSQVHVVLERLKDTGDVNVVKRKGTTTHQKKTSWSKSNPDVEKSLKVARRDVKTLRKDYPIDSSNCSRTPWTRTGISSDVAQLALGLETIRKIAMTRGL